MTSMMEDAETLLLQDRKDPAVELLQTLSEEKIAQLLRDLPWKWRREYDTPHVHAREMLRHLPERRVYEYQIWSLGETLRQTIIKRKALGRSKAVLDACINIAVDTSLGTGREPFFELIAKHGAKRGDSRAQETILKGIEDPVVVGHALRAANIAKLSGVDELVRGVAETTDKAWIRREAKKYLKRTGAT